METRARKVVAWVLVKELHLNYHNKETILFTIDPYDGNSN